MRRINKLLLFICTVASIAMPAAHSVAQDGSFQRMAPENCWAYSYWVGEVQYDANSKNRTEKMMAEPEVKRFVEDAIKRIGLLGPAMMTDRSPEQQKLMHSLGPKMTNLILKRKGCFFLEKIKFDARATPQQAKALMCLDAGDEASAIAAELSQMFNNPTKVTLSEVTFNKFLLSEEPKAELLIGSLKEKLIVAIGEETVVDTLKRIASKKVPTWMAKSKTSKRNVKRLTNYSYFNIKEMTDTLAPMGDRETLMMIGALGLGNINSMESSSGLTENESYSRMFIDIDGRPEGLLDLHSQKGLQLEELGQIPDDSLFAFAFSLDTNRAFRMFSMLARQMNPRGRDEVSEAIAEIKREVGVDIKTGLIDNIGDTWTLHNGAGDGWVSGLTLTGSVKSSEKLSAALNAIVKKAIIETDGSRYAPKFRKRTVGNNEIFSLQSPDFSFPFQLSWCVADNRIIIALFPQAIEAALTPGLTTPLIDPAKMSAMSTTFIGEESNSRVIAFAYGDTKSQFPITYAYAQMAMSMSQAMARDSFAPQAGGAIGQLLQGVRLPPARLIHRHLGPTMMTARQTDDGIEIETTQTIPSLDAGYIAPVAIGALLPAVQQVRGAARRVTSMNNLRQCALAAHNFESAYMSFPAAYSVDDKGKKLLSWRVHILPFIEQNELYEKFNLKEPWDSPTNKKLIEQMPEVFRSPISSAAVGKTTYRSTAVKTGIIGAPKKPFSNAGSVGFGAITDGSSNTIMYVETSDKLAQFWTQPDEGIDPADFDLKAIFGAYPGGTNVAMGDGSGQFLSETVDKDSFKNLLERADGNIVTIDDFDADTKSRRRRRGEKIPNNPMFDIDSGDIELNIQNLLSKTEILELEKQRKLERIRDIALACLNFESAHNKFPSAYTTNKKGKKLLSWRVHILPYLDEAKLYNKFKQDEPWDSEHNIALLREMPEIFNMSESQLGEGETTILGMGGPSGIFTSPSKNGPASIGEVGFADLTDGSSTTLLLINAPEELAVEWTKPSEFDPDEEAIKLFVSRGFTSTLVDGSMAKFGKDITPEEFKSMSTRDGGENFSPYERRKN
ncbi:MAG: DUF1559 domain-containing protein [Mariniblastus sp.]